MLSQSILKKINEAILDETHETQSHDYDFQQFSRF